MLLFGHIALPLFFAVSLGILAIYSFWRPRRVVDLVTEPHGHFTPMLRTSHTVLELMPDTPEVEATAAPANEAEMFDEHPVAQEEPMPPRTGTL